MQIRIQKFEIGSKSVPNGRLGIFGILRLVLMLVVAGSFYQTAQAASQISKEEVIRGISKQFSEVPTMAGEFVQFGPNGEQTGGKFYIQRPGKIRFNYEDPSPIQVISNGITVAVNNRKLKTWNFYPLSKTPLKMLLNNKLSVNDKSIKSVKTEGDITTVVMKNKRAFGKAEITLLFDPESFDLRQWTIKDAQGKETSVMVFNVQKGIKIPKSYFVVDKGSILHRNDSNQNR